MKKRVAILISGRGSNMSALVAAAQAPGFPAEIAVVIANKADAAGLAYAAAAGVPTAVVASKLYGKDREAFDAALQQEIAAHGADAVCLAGFMRVLGDAFVNRWQGRMLNVHPSLLPNYRGLHTHERALADGVKIHGASVHFVVPEMDAGPIIMQGAVPVRDGDDADSLAARVLAVEHRIYPAALRLFAEGRLRIDGSRCLVDGAATGQNADGGAFLTSPPLNI